MNQPNGIAHSEYRSLRYVKVGFPYGNVAIRSCAPHKHLNDMPPCEAAYLRHILGWLDLLQPASKIAVGPVTHAIVSAISRSSTVRVGIVGTGAISAKHALAYHNIGFEITVCTNTTASKGQAFAAAHGAEFVSTIEELCCHPRVDYVDLCTFPNFRLPVLELCALNRKHLLVQKPMATDLTTAQKMISVAASADIRLGVVSQRRFDDSIRFLKHAIDEGRLGRILQADAYVRWYRSPSYYGRPIKGSWTVEGGGALINQGIHQVDLLLYLVGPVTRIFGEWQLGALHPIESEDSINAVLRYESGAIGVLQASTALWPGYPERIEIYGTNGTAIITGDKLTTWDVQQDIGVPVPIASQVASGASDPMAISVVPFERQFLDFAEACREGRIPLCSGLDGYRALQLVLSIYESCRTGLPIPVANFK
jgi:UDP-N-acetyl-2-amino-2-deoxyglucuronate dehydrogenase